MKKGEGRREKKRGGEVRRGGKREKEKKTKGEGRRSGELGGGLQGRREGVV